MLEQLTYSVEKPGPSRGAHNPEFAGSNPAAATILAGEQLVKAEELRLILWGEKSRPSVRWILEQAQMRNIPSVRLSRKLYFYPSEVKREIEKKHTVRVR